MTDLDGLRFAFLVTSPPPCTVDLAGVLAAGRRLRWRRRIVAAGAASLTAALLTAGCAVAVARAAVNETQVDRAAALERAPRTGPGAAAARRPAPGTGLGVAAGRACPRSTTSPGPRDGSSSGPAAWLSRPGRPDGAWL